MDVCRRVSNFSLNDTATLFKGFPKMGKPSRNATDEGAKADASCNRRTLIRRLRPKLRSNYTSTIIGKALKATANSPINQNLTSALKSVRQNPLDNLKNVSYNEKHALGCAHRARGKPTADIAQRLGACRRLSLLDFSNARKPL